jgi:hypothetical protein
MKKSIKIAGAIFVAVLFGGWIYWQQIKKSFIKDKIETAVNNKTDSLYFIKYDSSSIDEINGNASFYNVVLQSDSLQKQLADFDTASSTTVYNIHIDELTIKGANLPGLISSTAIQAKSILIRHPVVYIINSGKKEKDTYGIYDTLAIYEKMLGKFKSIRSEEIEIENGVVNFSDKSGEPHTALKDVSVVLKNFRIDSTKDYQNVISYFVKDMVAKVKEVYIKKGDNIATFTDVEYNAPEKLIRLKKFQQKNKDGKVIFDISNTSLSNISTDAFILKQQLKAEELKSDGGLLTFYRTKNTNNNAANDKIEIDNNYFDEALLNKISIGSTKLLVYDKKNPAAAPFTLTNVKFNAVDIQKVSSGITIKNLIKTSTWALSADGFSYPSEDKNYKMNIGAFDINSTKSTLNISSFAVVPQLTEAAFSKSIKYQADLYNINLKNIALSGVEIKTLIAEKKLLADMASLQLTLKVFNDRTVTPNPASKVGKYPHQLLQNVKFPVSIKKVIVKDSYVAYKERGAISEKTGVVFFKNVNGTVNNVTNIKSVIAGNNMMTVNATASFLGVSNIQTNWQLPLNTANGAFTISGTGGSYDATALNPVSEPLGMVAIKKGRFNKLTFNLSGNDLMAKGTSTLLYEDLKLTVLKPDSPATKKKVLLSFVANFLVINNNPQNGEVRKNDVTQERDITKSFFYLVWKSIFAAAKKTATGKNTGL